MTTIPHPAAAGFVSASIDNPLLLPGKAPVFVEVTLLTGTAYKAGSVLGQIGLGSASSAAKSGGNTGDGTLTLDATTPVLAGAKSGVYTVRCIAADTDSGTFRVEDPDGNVLGDVVVGATFSDDIKFVISDGGTDFIVGDGFDITVAVGSGKFKLAASAAVDGSDAPVAILGEDVDATGGDKTISVMVEGYFNETALVFGTGHTADTVRLALRARGIHLRTMKYSG